MAMRAGLIERTCDQPGCGAKVVYQTGSELAARGWAAVEVLVEWNNDKLKVSAKKFDFCPTHSQVIDLRGVSTWGPAPKA